MLPPLRDLKVSDLVASLLPGLLTVDTKSRLRLAQLTSHPWLAPQSAPSTPLQTSCVLGREKGTASAINHTFHAFHQATREGFTLGDVSRAPLAKRRKHKQEQSLSPTPSSGQLSPTPSSSQLSPTPSSSQLTRPSKLELQTDTGTQPT